MNERDRRVALLIDADNAPASKIDLILAEVARHGTANVRRAYGNWKSPHLKGWEAVLHSHAIRPVQQFAYSTGKNASDMAMVVDAMDLLYAHTLDAFAIVSSDADFTPLVMRILTDGLKVYGFGERKTPEAFVNACSQFVYVEGLREPVEEAGGAAEPGDGAPLGPVPTARLRADTRLVRMIRSAVDAAGGDDGWANLSAVGSQIGNQASLDPRNYGYRKLSDLVEATALFDIRRDGQSLLLRHRDPSAGPAPATPDGAAAERTPRRAAAQRKTTQKATDTKAAARTAPTKAPAETTTRTTTTQKSAAQKRTAKKTASGGARTG